MTVASAIEAKQQQIADAYASILEKGGTLPANQNLFNLASTIDNIPGGGLPSYVLNVSSKTYYSSDKFFYNGNYKQNGCYIIPSFTGNSQYMKTYSSEISDYVSNGVISIPGFGAGYIYYNSSTKRLKLIYYDATMDEYYPDRQSIYLSGTDLKSPSIAITFQSERQSYSESSDFTGNYSLGKLKITNLDNNQVLVNCSKAGVMEYMNISVMNGFVDISKLDGFKWTTHNSTSSYLSATEYKTFDLVNGIQTFQGSPSSSIWIE